MILPLRRGQMTRNPGRSWVGTKTLLSQAGSLMDRQAGAGPARGAD